MLGLTWWMLGDEFIDIPSLGWVEISDDNYDYYHKTITTVFFLWWCHQAPGLGFSALRRRLRTGCQSRVDGAGAPELLGQEGQRCSKWRCLKMGPKMVSFVARIIMIHWNWCSCSDLSQWVCLRKGCTHVYPMQIWYQNMTQQWTLGVPCFQMNPSWIFKNGVELSQPVSDWFNWTDRKD